MQELVTRAKELLKDGTVTRVLGWKNGDLAYNPEPAFFETEEGNREFEEWKAKKEAEKNAKEKSA